MKKLIALLMVLTMVVSLCACGSKSSDSTADSSADTESSESSEATEDGDAEVSGDQVININFSADPETWDPCDDVTTTSCNMYMAVEATLYRSTEEGDKASAAESVDVNDDCTVYTFHLREGMKFADGSALTAHDFEYTWKRLLDPEVADDYAWYLADFVVGGYELNGLVADDFDSEEDYKAAIEEAKENVGVKALDDNTLEVTLVSGCPYFTNVVTHPCLGVLSEAFVEALPEGTAYGTSADTTLCSGPFTIESWSDDQSVVLKKNENYFDADIVNLDTINISFIAESSTELLMFENDEIDMTWNDMSTADAATYEGTDEYHLWDELDVGWIDFNCSRYPYDDPLVREALCVAINYDELCSNIIGSGATAATGFVPAGMPNCADTTKKWREDEDSLQITSGDTEKAIELLKEAGWEQAEDGTWSKDGEAFPTVAVNYRQDNDSDANIANAICGYWAKIGIPAEPDPMESALRSEIRPAHDFDVTFAGWGADYQDASNFLVCLTSDHYYNYGAWYNEEYDALIEKAASTADQEERYEAMCEAEDIIFEEYPVICFEFACKGYLEKTKVHDVQRPSLGIMDFETAYVSE